MGIVVFLTVLFDVYAFLRCVERIEEFKNRHTKRKVDLRI